MGDKPPVPLDHRVRRRILRRLHRDFTAHTAAELSKDLGLAPNKITYHCEVLTKWRKVKARGGPHGVLFESLSGEQPEVIALLVATTIEDESE